jgi:hypothetical protein
MTGIPPGTDEFPEKKGGRGLYFTHPPELPPYYLWRCPIYEFDPFSGRNVGIVLVIRNLESLFEKEADPRRIVFQFKVGRLDGHRIPDTQNTGVAAAEGHGFGGLTHADHFGQVLGVPQVVFLPIDVSRRGGCLHNDPGQGGVSSGLPGPLDIDQFPSIKF